MANPNPRFVSVNLNKSYGQPQHPRSSSSSYYHHHAANGGVGPRSRPSGGGRGMVVLSRPGQKGAPKLSVPAPLNLPSLRKEHERFDPAAIGSTSGPTGHALGPGHAPHAMGWSKPASADGPRDRPASGEPPLGSPTRAASAGAPDRAVFLRGEDFPSLKSTFLSGQKLKDPAGARRRPEEPRAPVEHMQRPSSEPFLTMRPHGSRPAGTPDLKEQSNDEVVARGGKKAQNQDGLLSGPLPLIQFKHASDWADDERDTSYGILDRGRDRDRGYSDGRGNRDLDFGDKDHGRADPFRRDAHTPGKNASSWRSPLHTREGYAGNRESGLNRDGHGFQFLNHNRNSAMKDSNVKFGNSLYAESMGEGSRLGYVDQQNNWRTLGHGQGLQTARGMEMYNGRHAEKNENGWHFDASSDRYKGDSLQKNTPSKLLSTRGVLLDDPILNLSRDSRSNGKASLENAVFESRDPFSGGLSGDANSKLFRRKKDVHKQVDFYDPVRESFEAELERVQKLQEEERQRAIQEHARALEMARREEEERVRLFREEEEQRRRLEEEAREAAWRAEQERLNAAKRVEEQRLAREEEKRRMLMEEERRKEAARQKLLELEARIARRQAEEAVKENWLPVSAADDRVTAAKECDAGKTSDAEYWEDGERMVECVTSSTLSEPTVVNRFTVPGPTLPINMEGNLHHVEQGKLAKTWRNGTYDVGNSSSVFLERDSESHIVKRDAFDSSRVLPRKGFFTGQGASHLRPSSEGGPPDVARALGDYNLPKGQRWNASGESEGYSRNTFVDYDLLESGKHEVGWDQNRRGGSPHVIYTDNVFPGAEIEGFLNTGRARQYLRQPRVFPPPTFTSGHRDFVRDGPKHPSSTFFESERNYETAEKSEDDQAYESEDHEQDQQPDASSSQKALLVEPNAANALECGSPSSVSPSNPPISPTHLLHDDLDDSAGFPSLPSSADGRPIAFSEGEHVVQEVGNANNLLASRSSPFSEEEEWSSGNNAESQEQEEYDEDDYHEEGEPREGDENILDIAEAFVLSSDMQNVSTGMQQDQKVLGFNDGVEVLIPNDDFEVSSTNVVKNIEVEMVPKEAALRLDSSDGPIRNENDLHLQISTYGEDMGTSGLIDDAEKALHGLVVDPVASTTDEMKSSEMSSSVVASVQTFSASSFDLSRSCSSPGQLAPSPTSTVQGQSEAAMQLQFGLFSGPSLIPSPVPAIQIGSIQMPLNIHSPIGTSHVHSSQPPFFQFGQLRYTSPVSQGILPIGPQSIPYVQPSLPVHYSVTQIPASSLGNHATLSSSATNVHKENSASSVSSTNKSNNRDNTSDESCSKQEFTQGRALHVNECSILSHDHAECSSNKENKSTTGLDTLVKIQENYEDAPKNDSTSVYNKSERQFEPHVENKSSPCFSVERPLTRTRVAGPILASRGKRYIYTVKNRGPQAQFSVSDIPRAYFNNDRRTRRSLRCTEFRVRESDRKRFDASDAMASTRQNEKPYSSGNVAVPSLRSGSKRDFFFSKSSKMAVESDSSNIGFTSLQSANLDRRRKTVKESLIKMPVSTSHSCHGEGSIKRNEHIEEDVDAPLQSGVVRVYKQPGIETPSDEDDFIEVRSKRQMLNDRREQREKENKAKSRDAKTLRKPRSISRTNTVSSKPSKVMRGGISKGVPTSFSMELSDLNSSGKSSAVPMTTASQPLAPIGTPTMNIDTDKQSLNKESLEISSAPVAPSGAQTELMPHSIFEKVAPFENVTASLGSWADVHANQQVMTLTQTQLEEAMKPECFDTCGSLVVEHDSVSKEQEKMSKSVVTQDKSFSTSGSPLSSLLAGERIQFGAVTTPSFLPSVTQAISNGTGPLPSPTCKTESSKEHTSASENAHAIFFEKEKHCGESCIHLEDSEAEAEAAASAVAVAAISSDEVVGNGLCTTSVSVSDHGKFGSVDGCGLTSQGGSSNGQVTSLSTGEESLPVTLPADLSVENPLPPWPVLPTQRSSSTMFSQFAGPPPSHFPCFEMNPMLRTPILAFGPQEESSRTQSQPKRSTALGPGPLGAWSHSGMDSFYGPPAGFAGHFVSPPAGMPGVQAPPQMVFYNHFPTLAPFGVGIMGTTFISSGKQPDWKHTPVSSAMDVNEGDDEKMTGRSAQHISPGMPPSLQHLSPASPLVPMASPLPMFDMSSFQSTVDVPVQASWSHLPPTPLHGTPFPPLPRNQIDNGIAADVSQRLANSSSVSHKFPKFRPTTVGEAKFTFSTDPSTQFPAELSLVNPPSSVAARVSSSGSSHGPLSGNNDDKGPKETQSFARSSGGSCSASVSTVAGSNNGSGNNSSHGIASTSKPQIALQRSASPQQKHHPVGYTDKWQASSSQKTSGGEWHRRAGSQGRSHASSGPERTFLASKMKQIYVAKSPANRATTG